MNEHLDDHFDDAIDRAARELVQHDPPARLHAAVVSEIRATRTLTRVPWRWWALAAVPAAAVVVVVLTLRDQPLDSPVPGGHESTIVKTLVAPSPDVPAAAAVPAPAGRRLSAAVAVQRHSNPAALVRPIKVGAIRMDSVEIATIPIDEVPIRPIHIEEITVGER